MSRNEPPECPLWVESGHSVSPVRREDASAAFELTSPALVHSHEVNASNVPAPFMSSDL